MNMPQDLKPVIASILCSSFSLNSVIASAPGIKTCNPPLASVGGRLTLWAGMGAFINLLYIRSL